jgi:hypothetical protein
LGPMQKLDNVKICCGGMAQKVTYVSAPWLWQSVKAAGIS